MVAALGEEVIFRGLFQARLGWFIGVPCSIAAAAICFGLAHLTHRTPAIVFADIALVVVDGLFYGIIFARSKNIFVAWATHSLADIIAMAIFLLL